MAEPAKLPVPQVRVELEGIARRNRFEAWHEALSPVYDAAPVGAPPSFSGRLVISRPGELVLFEGSYTPQTCTRTRRHTDDLDHFQLVFYKRGGFAGSRAGVPFQVIPDRIALCDFGRPHDGVVSEPSELLVAAIPRTHIDATRVADRPTICWSSSSAAGRLLVGALQTLCDGVDHWSPEEAAEASAGLIGLVNGLLGSHRQVHDPQLVQQICLPAIQRYIGQHLHRKELNAAALCRRFGCSRSRLYDLFQEHGGVEAYLRQRRLAHCFLELAAADPGCGRVKEVAERWGFDDPSHFHRLFKQHFGVSPSEVLADLPARHAHRSSDRPGLPAGTIDTWLREL